MHTEDEKGMIIASLAERLAFTQFFEKRKDFEIIEMSRVIENKSWDVKILSGGTEYLIEVKVRKSPPSKRLRNGWMIQQDKHTFLLEHSTEIGYSPLYLNFFYDGIYNWNLNDVVIPEWEYGYFNKNNQTGKDEKVRKLIADLHIDDSCGKYDETYDIVEIYKQAELMYLKDYVNVKLKPSYPNKNKWSTSDKTTQKTTFNKEHSIEDNLEKLFNKIDNLSDEILMISTKMDGAGNIINVAKLVDTLNVTTDKTTNTDMKTLITEVLTDAIGSAGLINNTENNSTK